MIPYARQDINKEDIDAVKKVLKSDWLTQGPMVERFEKAINNYTNSRYAVAVSSATGALHISCLALGVGPGDWVWTSPNTFVSSANCILYCGAKVDFVDIDPKTYNISISRLEAKLKEAKKKDKLPKVLIPVHFGGLAANLSEIKSICKENNLHLVEDAAHASGSIYKKKKIGVHGDMVCFSFHPVKNLAMPTGGLIAINTKNHKKVSVDLKEKRWCGISNRKGTKYDVKNVGWNYYMNEFSAAIGIEQLKKLNRSNKARQTIAKKYSNKINLEHKMPFAQGCSYHLYWIRVKNRNSFRKKMNDLGIETGVHYQPIHTFSMYRQKNHLPVTDEVGKEIVSIPIHPNLSNTDISKIISSINKYA